MAVSGLYDEPTPFPLVRGRTANAVTSATDRLFVTIDSFGPGKWGPVVWSPRGKQYPPVGTLCLLARDSDKGVWWVVQWAGDWTDQPIPAPTWAALSLNGTNWQNYPSPSWAPAEYCVEPTGFVSVRGLVRTTTPFAFGAASATIGTLPVGARPAVGKRQFWFVYCIDSANNKSWTRLDIAYPGDPDYPGKDGALMLIAGDAIVSSGSGANNGSVQYLNLTGIRFAAGSS